MRALEEATRATPQEIAKIKRFLAERSTDARVSRALLARLPGVSPSEADSLRAGLGEKRRPLILAALLAVPASGGLLLAALALLFFLLRPAPPRDVPLELTIAEAAPGDTQLSEDVRLSARGSGTVSGTTRAPVVRWTQGTLSVEVTPGQGIALSVETREAIVRVVGTAFSVRRDALGTRVDVDHGRVEVTCVSGGEHLLSAAEHTTCLPLTPAGLLGRANALKTAGAEPREVLETVDRALPDATGPFRAELLALKAEMSLAEGLHTEALLAARAYLESKGPRRVEMLQIGARAAMSAEGCAGALPLLQSLEDLGAGDPEALAACEGQP